MFGFKRKNPTAKLRQQYQAKMAEGVELQRKGDIKGFAQATEEAEALWKKVEAAEAEERSTG